MSTSDEEKYFMKKEYIKQQETIEKIKLVDKNSETKELAFIKANNYLKLINKNNFAMFIGYISQMKKEVFEEIINAISSEDPFLDLKIEYILVNKIKDENLVLEILSDKNFK
ncbi:hypothetical protein COBT_001387 [Conglomerata obtusa]